MEEGLSGAPEPGQAAGEPLGGGDGGADSWLDLRTDVLTTAVNHGVSRLPGRPAERERHLSGTPDGFLSPDGPTGRARQAPILQAGQQRRLGGSLGGLGAPRVSRRAWGLDNLGLVSGIPPLGLK